MFFTRQQIAQFIAGTKYKVVEAKDWENKCNLANDSNNLRKYQIPNLKKQIKNHSDCMYAIGLALGLEK